ncbi:MAG: hypothetical protein KatS3mg061_2924 [Dehalococcoidia bacterium]|nr:MAG: hypothetical protein KatS3mg061_2924 [Dehalococcoidia bacterium]
MKRISRRTLLGAAGGLLAFDLAAPFLWPPAVAEPQLVTVPPVSWSDLRLGATFSPLEAGYMDLDPAKALAAVLTLNLDLLRLGAYWNALEPRPGEFAWEQLEPYLEAAERRGLPVILTVGMKAPVWPEYHLPWWVHETIWLPPTGLITRDPRLAERAHLFTRTVVERYASASGIAVFQVENEPFEPVLTEHGWTLDEPYLRTQVDIVRAADRLARPLLLTSYVREPPAGYRPAGAAMAAHGPARHHSPLWLALRARPDRPRRPDRARYLPPHRLAPVRHPLVSARPRPGGLRRAARLARCGAGSGQASHDRGVPGQAVGAGREGLSAARDA